MANITKENTSNEAEYDCLKLENQICFPLYAAANKVIKKYKSFLDELNLTYTQYITMMVMWSCKEINVKSLGKCLFLDSGTLTPLLKKLEQKGYIKRERSKRDERNLIVSITEKGEMLKEKASKVPGQVGKQFNLSYKEASSLYKILYKLLKES